MVRSSQWLILILLSIFLRSVNAAETAYRYTTQGVIYVVGAEQLSPALLIDRLRIIGVVDSQSNWTGSTSQVVIYGGVGEPAKIPLPVIASLVNIQAQASLVGGGLHFLLTRQMLQILVENQANTEAFRQWLKTFPAVLQINDQLFTAGGLATALEQYDLVEVNQRLHQSLSDSVAGNSEQELISPLNLHSKNSPVNYQGNLTCHPLFETDSLKVVLQHWQASRLWTSQQNNHFQTLQSRLDDRLLVINSAKVENEFDFTPLVKLLPSGELLVWSEKELDWRLPEIKRLPNRYNMNPDGMTDAEVETILSTAAIVHREKTEYGVTNPFKVTLVKDNKTYFGVFKYHDTHPEAETRMGWNQDKDYADRFIYEVAAYHLDRILTIGLVPVAIEREIDGQSGVIQIWIDDLMSKTEFVENKIPLPGYCEMSIQENMMNAFDYFVRNIDRNWSNTLFGASDGQIWFIDHSQAFGTSLNRSQKLRKIDIHLTDSFKAMLEKLTQEELEQLSPWLHVKQRKALWKRRKKMLRGIF